MKKTNTSSVLQPDETESCPQGLNIPATEFPSPLIYKLSEFYRRWPDYPTGIVDIAVLSRLLYTELDKFLHRPHKQVTQIFFDNEPTATHHV